MINKRIFLFINYTAIVFTNSLLATHSTRINTVSCKEMKHPIPVPVPFLNPVPWFSDWFTAQLSNVYGFTKNGFGKGQTVAIIELSGGYSDSDLTTYWGELAIGNPPVVKAIEIDGATNNFPSTNDWLVTADIEIIGSIAPDCSIVAIFAPNTTEGLHHALVKALEIPNVTIVSTVWGFPESQWSVPTMLTLDKLIEQATKRGVTVIASSGSQGSSAGLKDGKSHVVFPASSPNVLAVGSTTLITNSTFDQPVFECAWDAGFGLNASGGGVSEIFQVPTYQSKNGICPTSNNAGHKKGRGVPDVSIIGDTTSHFPLPIFVEGFATVAKPYFVGPFGVIQPLPLPAGTTATPVWAGIVARLNSIAKKPLGLLQPKLYKNASRWFRDITLGSNGAYKAKKGYDLVTGLGVPNCRLSEIAK